MTFTDLRSQLSVQKQNKTRHSQLTAKVAGCLSPLPLRPNQERYGCALTSNSEKGDNIADVLSAGVTSFFKLAVKLHWSSLLYKWYKEI